MSNPLTTAYLSFDVVPSHKGAAIHIESFVRALTQTTGTVDLVTVSPTTDAHITVDWPQVTHTVLPAVGKTLLDRVLDFRRHLQLWLQDRQFDVIHVRSIFEGFLIAYDKERFCRQLIFEVNGLPSVELKYRYPRVAEDLELMHKIHAQEQICLEQADQIITPSTVTRDHLIRRGVPTDKIQVIPNGVDLSIFTYQPPRVASCLETLQLLYFGTLSAWQGVDLAIEALDLYKRDFDAQLTIIGPARGKQIEALQKLARKLSVTNSIHIIPPVSQSELVHYMHQADAIVAPLKANDRNLVQGCCPLKVLEGMASGTPVITSDLPIVQDLGEADQHFLAVRPGSAKAIKDGMLQLRTNPDLRLNLARAARTQIEQYYTWEHAHHQLLDTYEALMSPVNHLVSI